MAKPDDQPAIQLDDRQSNRLHAVWSRSGKRLIVSVAARGKWDAAGQVELTSDQVATLRDFLAKSPR
jgi:hypothetical protein